MKSLLSACNFSRFISTVISKGSLWRPSFSGDLGLSNENIIYPVTSELQEMVCWLFSDSLEIGSCGEGLRGFVKHETKGGLAPQSTVSGLRDFRKMHTSIWKILYGTICMFAKLRFSSSENIYLEKKKLWKYLFQCNPFLHHVLNVVSVVFWPSETQLSVQPLNGSVPWLGIFRFKVLVLWDWWSKYLCLVKKSLSWWIYKSSMHHCLLVLLCSCVGFVITL